MTAVELLQYITQAILITLSLITLVMYFIRRDGPHRDVALALGALAFPYYLQVIVPPLLHIFSIEMLTLLGFSGYAALLAQPYLTLRLARYAYPVPKLYLRLALAGMLASWVGLYVNSQSASSLIILGITIYFAAVDGYATISFLRAAGRNKGIARHRLYAAALGCGLLTFVLLLVCIQIMFPSFGASVPLMLVLMVTIGLAYYAAFAPPRWLRRLWQYGEVQDFLFVSAARNRDFNEQDIFDLLTKVAWRSVGGRGATHFKWDADSQTWSVFSYDGTPVSVTPALHTQLDALKQHGQPMVLRTADNLPQTQRAFLDESAAGGALILPVRHSDTTLWGAQVVLQHYGSLFASDDVRLLTLFIDHSLMLVDNGAMVGQLRRYSHVLETLVDERTAALSESEARYRQIFENAQEGIWLFDADDNTALVNPRMASMLGYDEEEMLGMNLSHFVVGEYTPEHILRNRTAEAWPRSQELPLTKQSGEHLWVTVSAKTLPDETGTLAMVVDITERKAAEEEVIKLNNELERRVVKRTEEFRVLNEELEAFSYSVSHDLRAPLRSIIGFSHALLEDYGQNMDEQAKNYLDRINRASLRMNQLIDDLLQLSRVTRSELYIANIDMSRIARDIMGELAERSPERTIVWNIEDGIRVDADSGLLRVIIENLFENAHKYTRKQAEAKICLGQCTDTETPTYFIRDNGVGFDMTYADKLFGAFQRLHSPQDFEGTGIGLATVRRILQRHGGSIWADSTPNQGATFYFTFGIHHPADSAAV